MIDTHAHIDGKDFDSDRLEVINQAFDLGMEYIIIPAIKPSTFDNVLSTAELHPNIYCGMGIHPHNANDATPENLNRVTELTSNKKVKAIGEIGLDYYYDFAPKDRQKDAFAKQIEIALSKNLPCIVHNRESDKDLLDILKYYQNGELNAVLHCFSGDTDMARKALDMNLHVSFTGNITFKKSTLSDVVDYIPLDKIMIETDSPFMTPAPHRGKRNTPALVRLVAEKIAEIKNISINEVIDMTSNTAKNFFKLLLILAFLVNFNILNAQEETEETEEIPVKNETYNPFRKQIGIGIVGGANTIVETYQPSVEFTPNDIAYEGVAAIGAELQFAPLDYMSFGITYLNSKNKKRADNDKLSNPNSILPYDYYNFYEFTSYWFLNPSGKLNFYGIIGLSMITSDIGKVLYGTGEPIATSDVSNKLAINGGLGFSVNLPVKGVGLFNFQAEWKLDYRLGTSHFETDPRFGINDPRNKHEVDQSIYFSIPRAKIIYFPNLW